MNAQDQTIAALRHRISELEVCLPMTRQNMAYRDATQALLDSLMPHGGDQRAVLAELAPLAAKEGECVALPAALVLGLLRAHFRARDTPAWAQLKSAPGPSTSRAGATSLRA